MCVWGGVLRGQLSPGSAICFVTGCKKGDIRRSFLRTARRAERARGGREASWQNCWRSGWDGGRHECRCLGRDNLNVCGEGARACSNK